MRKFKKEDSVKLSLDVRRRQLNIEFIAPIYDGRYLPQSIRLQDYLSLFRTRIEFIQLTKIWETRDPKSGDVTLFFILETPALYFRRLKNIRSTFQSDKKWREIDAWLRQTALMHNPHIKDKQTTNLYRKDQIVDIGKSFQTLI